MDRIRSPYGAIVAGGLVGLVAAAWAFWAMPDADRSKFPFEVGKAAVGILPLAFFGAFVSELVTRRDARQSARTHRDAYLRTFRAEIIAAYNQKKATRRRLRGAGLTGTSAIVLTEPLLALLDAEMSSLIQTQLTLERLAREVESPAAPLYRMRMIQANLSGLESYLHDVIEDWENNRAGVAVGSAARVLADWDRYSAFVADRQGEGDFGTPSDLMKALEQILLQERDESAAGLAR
jgi:hypothetical protein